MNKIKLVLLSLFSVTTLLSQSKESKNVIVPLTNVINVDNFGIYFKNEFIIQSATRFQIPKNYIQAQKNTHIGIPVHDSISYYSLFSDHLKVKELYDFGDINLNEYKENISWYKKDSLHLYKVKKRESLIIIVGFYKNKQFIIADANHNKDFSDDIKYEFDIKFRDNPVFDNIRNLPVSKYTYEYIDNGILKETTRAFVMYPDKDNPKRLNYSNKDREYLSQFKFVDNWKGEMNFDNENFHFNFIGAHHSYGLINIKPTAFKDNPIGSTFCNQFNYQIGDTVTLARSRYKIDSLDMNMSKLYLTFVENKKDNYGCIINYNIKPFTFKTIDNKVLNTTEIFKSKQYTLIEFWGTWCGPCVMMTPKIKKLYKENASKLNIIGFSVEEKTGETKKYVTKHNMPWIHSIISSYDDPILKQFKIEKYPTFILVDSQGKILTKGSISNFDALVKLIQ